MSADIPSGWGERSERRRRGVCAHCGVAGSNVSVVTQATMRHGGSTKSLKAVSVALCNDHALELFAAVEELSEGYRQGGA